MVMRSDRSRSGDPPVATAPGSDSCLWSLYGVAAAAIVNFIGFD